LVGSTIAGAKTANPGCEGGASSASALELLEELARRARDKDPTAHVALAVLQALDDAGWLAALGTVRALGRIHYFLAVSGLGDLSHGVFTLLSVGSPGLIAAGCGAGIKDGKADASRAGTATL